MSAGIGDLELLGQFLIEGRELVDRASQEAAALCAAPSDTSLIDSLFRSLHTLKGSTGLFDLPVLTRLLHAAETVLEAARKSGALTGAARIVEVLDVTDRWLDDLEAARPPGGETLARATALAAVLSGGAATSETNGPDSDDAWAQAVVERSPGAGPRVAVRYRPGEDAYFRGDDPLAIVRGLPGLLSLSISAPAVVPGEVYDPFQCRLEIDALCAAPIAEVQAALRFVADEARVVAIDDRPAAPAVAGLRSLRVEPARLDAIAALVDELVVAKNALQHEVRLLAEAAGAAGRSRALTAAQAAIDRAVGDLHAGVTDLRMVELGRLFGRFPRQVREIAERLGKPVDIDFAGEAVRLDKTVVEGLYEPLLHLVRNAIDHGVEDPATRRAAGKSPIARLSLSARARGEEVVVEVSDDGRGLDVQAIRAAAVARGVVTERQAKAMSDAEIADLVFAAGFSTARAVSDLSGRGVGMDAVRAAVTQLGGRASLENRPGRGLSVSLILPAQVVLARVLTVTAGGQRFGVALDAVDELHQVSQQEISLVKASRAYVRRERVTPLLRLADLLGLPVAADVGSFPVLSVMAGGEPVGLQIEGIGERIEAPLRPMAGLLAGYPGLLGTVIGGDGQVLLVLDIEALAA